MNAFKPLSAIELSDYHRNVWTERRARRRHLDALGDSAVAALARRKLEFLRGMPRFDSLPPEIRDIFGQPLVGRESRALDRALEAGVEERRVRADLVAIRRALGLEESKR